MKVLIVLILSSLLTGVSPAGENAYRLRSENAHGETRHGTCSALDCGEFKDLNGQYIVTAAHVTGAAGDRLKIEAENDRWIDCTLLAIDREDDIAILKASALLPKSSKLAPDGAVTVSGSPTSKPVITERGTVRALVLRLDVMAHGMSGGPVFDLDGNLAGIIVAGIADDNGAMKHDTGLVVAASVIRHFLSTLDSAHHK